VSSLVSCQCLVRIMIITFPSGVVWYNVMSISVHLSVCLFVFCLLTNLKSTQPIFTNFCTCYLTALQRVLPVLWITSHFYSMEPVGQNQAWSYIYMKFTRWLHQLNITQLVLDELVRIRHWGSSLLSTGALFWLWTLLLYVYWRIERNFKISIFL